MSTVFDKTLKDTNRRAINLRESQVDAVLPSHFLADYPKFVTFLKKYYEFENDNASLTRFINNVFETRDVSQTDLDLLEYFEDEYLLGQNYFQGFIDKRTAVKYSSYLYRSKGTKYSIRQFFKTFFGIEPDVVYTKQYIFNLNESKIGSESARYLTDDKLYQTFALQIRSELSLAQWRDAYKLLVHPAGMYLGGLTQIVGEGRLDSLQYDPGEALKPPIVLEGQADFDERAYEQHTALFDINNPTDVSGSRIQFRMRMGSSSGLANDSAQLSLGIPRGNDINDLENLTIDNIDRMYSSLGEYLTPDSPTFDDDSDGTTQFAGFDFSSTERIDQEVFSWNPAVSRVDSDHQTFSTPVGDSDSEISLREAINRNF
ncbi:hypothetical protein OAS42_00460 [bacterium]|nr:hypothetical protein [bacterium]